MQTNQIQTNLRHWGLAAFLTLPHKKLQHADAGHGTQRVTPEITLRPLSFWHNQRIWGSGSNHQNMNLPPHPSFLQPSIVAAGLWNELSSHLWETLHEINTRWGQLRQINPWSRTLRGLNGREVRCTEVGPVPNRNSVPLKGNSALMFILQGHWEDFINLLCYIDTCSNSHVALGVHCSISKACAEADSERSRTVI